MLIGFARRYRYPVLLTLFGDYLYYSSEWRTDHFQLALEFVDEYWPLSVNTNVVLVLQEVLRLARRKMTIYVVSDMEIHNVQRAYITFKELNIHSPRIVLFLIHRKRRVINEVCEIIKESGIQDIRGYW